MNGEQKTVAIVAVLLAGCLAWGIWKLAEYNGRVVSAEVRPSADVVLSCVNACARACMAEEMP